MTTTDTYNEQAGSNNLLSKIISERVAQPYPTFKLPSAATEKPRQRTSLEEMVHQSVRKITMPAGFVTSSGNVYAYVNGSTAVRFTIDSGDNFAELTERRICVFISEEDAAEHNAVTLNDFNPAYIISEHGYDRYKFISEPSQLPKDSELKLVRKLHKNDDMDNEYEIINATFIPEKNLIPVEKWSNADITGTHTYIGQKVATLIPTRSATVLRMKTAGQKCGKHYSYFDELENLLRR